MIFRNNRGFWRRRGIISLEERESIGNKDSAMQRLHDLNRELADYEAETGAPPRPPVRDTPPSEEEGRQ